MKVPSNIFRTYDIRGIYPDELSEESIYLIGRAFGTYLKRKELGNNVVLGSDNRSSSSALREALSRGLVESGCNVTDLGIVPTPLVNFLTFEKDIDAGLVVSASHNPSEYNGVKFSLKDAEPLFGNKLQDLLEIINSEVFEEGDGSYKVQDLTNIYLDYLKNQFHFTGTKHFVVNCGNGATSGIAGKIFESLGAKVTLMNDDYDSDFPNGMPNPEDGAYQGQLKSEILKLGADGGFGFDTDGDRVGFVDEKGTIYNADAMLLLFSKDILEKNPGNSIYYDIKCSTYLEDFIKDHGGVPHVTRTGRPFYLKALKDDSNAALAGELSCHTFFSDRYHGLDDGIYTACRFIEIMEGDEKAFSEHMTFIPDRIISPELKIPISTDDMKFQIVEKVTRDVLSNEEFPNVLTIDGVKVLYSKTGSFLIRASNTSAVIIIRIEAGDLSEMKILREEVKKLLSSYSLDLSSLDFN